MPELNADLVLEGGGVKGIALAGAYSVIEEQGYTIKRIAGTSAGSIVGALLAAGLTASELEQMMREIDYSEFRDEDWLDRVPLLGKPLSVIYRQGIYGGNYAHDWISERLLEHRVSTFADLPYHDERHLLPPTEQYRLVVMVSDISRGRLLRLPWGYPDYNRKADEQKVADAVRASMSIPFFFRPVRMTNLGDGQDSVLVDGGMLSNFPVDTFDAPQHAEPRWPTFGIKLSAKASSAADAAPADVTGTISMTRAMVKTMTGFYDRMHVDDPDIQARTIFVDTGTIQATDFGLDDADRDMLYQNGRQAATEFFATWDWEAYKEKYRGVSTP